MASGNSVQLDASSSREQRQRWPRTDKWRTGVFKSSAVLRRGPCWKFSGPDECPCWPAGGTRLPLHDRPPAEAWPTPLYPSALAGDLPRGAGRAAGRRGWRCTSPTVWHPGAVKEVLGHSWNHLPSRNKTGKMWGWCVSALVSDSSYVSLLYHTHSAILLIYWG